MTLLRFGAIGLLGVLLMAFAMRKANRKDLARLKALLEEKEE